MVWHFSSKGQRSAKLKVRAGTEKAPRRKVVGEVPLPYSFASRKGWVGYPKLMASEHPDHWRSEIRSAMESSAKQPQAEFWRFKVIILQVSLYWKRSYTDGTEGAYMSHSLNS